MTLNFDCWIYDNLVDLSIPSNMKKKLRLQHLQLIRQRLSYDNAGYGKDFTYDKAGDAKDMAYYKADYPNDFAYDKAGKTWLTRSLDT